MASFDDHGASAAAKLLKGFLTAGKQLPQNSHTASTVLPTRTCPLSCRNHLCAVHWCIPFYSNFIASIETQRGKAMCRNVIAIHLLML